MSKEDVKRIAAPESKAAEVSAVADSKKENSEPRESKKTSSDKSGSEKESQASQLIAMGRQAELFHTPSQDLFATVQVDKHFENWLIQSAGFRSWLTRKYFRAHEIGPSSYALDEALTTLKAIAQFDGKEQEVFLRVAQKDGEIYLDLANETWQAVKVTEHGWSVVNHPPIKFIRQNGMTPLPVPVPGGNVNELKSFVNFASDEDFRLLVAWTLAAFTYGRPYPILILSGEKGCAKSTTTKMLRKLVDPNSAPLRRIPKDIQDLALASKNSHVLALDNLSGLSQAVSDVLCCLATGGATTTRKLYTNDEEVIFQAKRPIILNGIGDIGTASDLLDRAILLTLPVIDTYKTEEEIETAFEAARPRILGALLNVVADGLKNLPNAQRYREVRMADFATWIGACEPALGWPTGSFIDIYAHNRSDARQVAIEASPIAEHVRSIVMDTGEWTGSASELLQVLNSRVNETVTRRYDWPRTPEKLAGLLNRIAPDLRKNGIEVKRLENRVGGTGKRLWRLEIASQDLQVIGQNIDNDSPFDDF